ncbi:hypothetical protein NY10_555 [Carnobacterium antarcticum]|nr:hypothetical protein NY10_555 [Carnobacterium sp. CP1]
MYIVITFICALGFAFIHFSSKYMQFANKVPRSRFLSLSAGVAVSYVFVHLLPQLNTYQQVVVKNLQQSSWRHIENHIYIIALAGLVLFYAMERLVKISRKSKVLKNPEQADSVIFWIHMGSFFIYNTVIGYLLVREEYKSPLGIFFYFLALGVHFITNDWSLRRDHKGAYDKYGRIILTAAPVLGWLIGILTELNEFVLSILQAFIAGGVILNVMKEELPEEQKSSLSSFLAGVIGYTVLLLLI